MKNSAIFYDITVEEAHEKAAAILDEHKAALEKMAEEHKTLSEEKTPRHRSKRKLPAPDVK